MHTSKNAKSFFCNNPNLISIFFWKKKKSGSCLYPQHISMIVSVSSLCKTTQKKRSRVEYINYFICWWNWYLCYSIPGQSCLKQMSGQISINKVEKNNSSNEKNYWTVVTESWIFIRKTSRYLKIMCTSKLHTSILMMRNNSHIMAIP